MPLAAVPEFSNVLAGERFGLATYGTQAHSWIMAHEDEAEAFGHFLDTFPKGAVLLVDTYDVRNAVKKIVALGRKPAGIRLDSGDLAKDSRWAPRELTARAGRTSKYSRPEISTNTRSRAFFRRAPQSTLSESARPWALRATLPI